MLLAWEAITWAGIAALLAGIGSLLSGIAAYRLANKQRNHIDFDERQAGSGDRQ